LGTRPRLLRMECAGGEPRVLHEGAPTRAAGPDRGPQRTLRTSIQPGMRVPGGAAITSRGVVFGEKVLLGEGASRLDLTLLDGRAEPRYLSLAGDWVLQDSRPGVGVLVSTMDPVPQVFLVKENEFLEMFRGR
ncbi:MAG TPA: hypothetical protein VFQ39_16370, partial [Longimicrobium sp.]|nr:hypothetical protein [Longimicrobium sp.]